ncbi:unnamed protein product [Pleuronectes platessa]|uniref:Uncharacterized protein n=1 Tax=Pleuronectes platessa TaxID=8262 RepID=A0A9N7TW62_PLEPL|nr:unnamed protein product [Pleuronectes platessa]
MSVRGHLVALYKCSLLLSLRMLLLVPAGLPVRSQGDSQSDNKVMDNITVRQGETVFLRGLLRMEGFVLLSSAVGNVQCVNTDSNHTWLRGEGAVCDVWKVEGTAADGGAALLRPHCVDGSECTDELKRSDRELSLLSPFSTMDSTLPCQ